MLRPLHSMKGYKLAAEDGEFGRVKDYLFDDEYWTVRYLVADTGRWIPHRKVLISPVSLGTPDWDDGRFPVKLTKEQVEQQPDLEADEPVSRRHEKLWYETYGYPFWGYGIVPPALFDIEQSEDEREESRRIDEATCLRSLEEVRGYDIEAPDGTIGRLEDLIMDNETWAIRYLTVNMEDRIPDRSVFLAPAWFESFDWEQQKLFCRFSRETVDAAPELHADMPITPAREKTLFDYFDVPGWASVTGRSEPGI
ncbi:MAG TPA: PRC-barrel domain-containing protein [Tichowtungia sp.]|nr:PRC-barrel domain-containing protein [Tichowtungia sp.]